MKIEYRQDLINRSIQLKTWIKHNFQMINLYKKAWSNEEYWLKIKNLLLENEWYVSSIKNINNLLAFKDKSKKKFSFIKKIPINHISRKGFFPIYLEEKDITEDMINREIELWFNYHKN